MRNHVTSVGDSEVNEVLVLADRTRSLASNDPGGVGSVGETRLARPLHAVEHGVSSKVVAHEVVFAVVEDDSDFAEDVWNQVEVASLEVVNEILINAVRACLPSAITNAELVADSLLVDPADNGVEVVAQRTIALLSDVIDVDVTSSVQANGFDLTAGIEGVVKIARVDIRGAGLVL